MRSFQAHSSRDAYRTVAVCAMALAVAGCRDAAMPEILTPIPTPLFSTSVSDGQFDLSNWTLLTLEGNSGGTATVTQELAGGNPGEFMKVKIVHDPASEASKSQVMSVHLRNGAMWNPSTDGAIASIDYAEDAILFVCFVGCAGQATGPAIRQGGKIYIAVAGFTSYSTFLNTWGSISGTLTESHFGLVPHPTNPNDFVDYSQRPDFSAGGSAIEIGFFRWTTHTGGSPDERTAGIDNWSVTVNPEAPPPPPPPPPPPNQAPTAAILSPADGATFREGDPVSFSGACTDPEDGACVTTVWESDLQGFIGSALALVRSDLVPGTHEVTLTGTDSDGASHSDGVTITIMPLTALERINQMKIELVRLFGRTELLHGDVQSLLNLLIAAEQQIRRNNNQAAIQQMNAFIRRLDQLRNLGRLPTDEFLKLQDAAFVVIRQLG